MILYIVLIGWDADTRTLRVFRDKVEAERFAANVRGRQPVYVDVKVVTVEEGQSLP